VRRGENVRHGQERRMPWPIGAPIGCLVVLIPITAFMLWIWIDALVN